MGVIPCDRQNCPGIMCDRHSWEHGRLCWECFEELVELGPQTDIKEFMESSKDEHREHKAEASKAYFEHIFPLGDGCDG